jgi:hypothetical protein
MPNIGQELSSLNFEAMIGGPLSAVVKAQAQSALTSVDFIKSVGFKTDDQGNITEPVDVTFSYTKEVEKEDGTGTEERVHSLTVPILTMLPIPFIRVEETTIDFNAKIVATEYTKTESEMASSAEVTAKAGWACFSASLKANFSYKKSSAQGSNIERTYSMNIHVRAVQDELPAGTERLISILENSVKETPKGQSPPPPP